MSPLIDGLYRQGEKIADTKAPHDVPIARRWEQCKFNAQLASRGKILCKPGKNVRYICPHHIDLSGDDQEVKLYFRVIEPASNVVIRTSSGDKILSTHRALKVNPGEMECVTVRTTESLTNEIAIDALKE